MQRASLAILFTSEDISVGRNITSSFQTTGIMTFADAKDALVIVALVTAVTLCSERKLSLAIFPGANRANLDVLAWRT